MGEWMQQYTALAKAYRENVSGATINAVHDFIEVLKGKDDADAKEALWRSYALLGFFKSAYEVFDQICNKSDKKQLKDWFYLKDRLDSHGDRFGEKPRKNPQNVGVVKTGLPVFRYVPDPVGANVLKVIEDGEVCGCCGKPALYYATAGMYSEEEVSVICAECIASGAAAEKFHGDFIQDAENVEDKDKQDELFHRTPGYISWQGEYWLAHCGDYMAFLGDVGKKELEEMSILDEVMEEYAGHEEYSASDMREYLTAKGSMAGYLFRCLHCGAHRIWVDAD